MSVCRRGVIIFSGFCRSAVVGSRHRPFSVVVRKRTKSAAAKGRKRGGGIKKGGVTKPKSRKGVGKRKRGKSAAKKTKKRKATKSKARGRKR